MMGQGASAAFFGLTALWFAVGVFRTHSMVRSAFSLLGTMSAIGALFIALEVEFLGVLQIMMMAGEMTIMAIFMVMFMMDPGGLGQMEMTHQKGAARAAGAAGAAVGLVLSLVADWGHVAAHAPTPPAQVQDLGTELLTRSMLIFETAGVSILVSMIASTVVAIARSNR